MSLKVCGSLLLGCVAVVYSKQPHDELEEFVGATEKETSRLLLGVEQQLRAAQQITGLFVLEDAQLEMFGLETRAKMHAIEREVKDEVVATLKEMDSLRALAVENVTVWRKTLQELKDATLRNQLVLERIRKKKEDTIQLDLEILQKQDTQQEEGSKFQAQIRLQRLQELNSQNNLERKEDGDLERLFTWVEEQDVWIDLEKTRELEEHEMEKHRDIPVSSKSELNGESVDFEKEGHAHHESAVKRLLLWYKIAEHALVEAVATIYQQFVLPVVVIIGFFLVLTVLIARLNALKRARRHRRVLYSGYPRSYRTKSQPENEASRLVNEHTSRQSTSAS